VEYIESENKMIVTYGGRGRNWGEVKRYKIVMEDEQVWTVMYMYMKTTVNHTIVSTGKLLRQ
jgi:hypothetical protein